MSEVTSEARLEDALNRIELLTESLADMELALEDRGWNLVGESSKEFSRDGLQRAAELCRVMAIASPLIKRGNAVRAAYVWGKGIGVTARADGTDGTEDVNSLIQEFLDDDATRACFSGAQAQIANENLLATDGNLFCAFVTRPLTGKVTPRLIDFDEISDVIRDPEDRATVWYYRRDWPVTTLDVATGREETVTRAAYYPDLRYRPRSRPRHIGGVEVRWDMPIYHVKVGGGRHWKFGIGDDYAALPWARSYKEFLESWAALMKALSRIAWQASSKNKAQAKRQKLALESRPHDPANPTGAGATVVATEDQKIEAVSKSGATIDAESGRPLLAMVAAALGLPVTTLSADPGQTGARAVAETLNTPTKLEYGGRREVWTDFYRAALGYVIDQAVIAPQGPLNGTVSRDGDRIIVELAGGTDRTLDITWPEIDEDNPKEIIDAIATAGSLEIVPPLVLLRLVLRALKVRDVDEILAQVTDPETGEFIPPEMNAGQALADDFRRGRAGGARDDYQDPDDVEDPDGDQ